MARRRDTLCAGLLSLLHSRLRHSTRDHAPRRPYGCNAGAGLFLLHGLRTAPRRDARHPRPVWPATDRLGPRHRGPRLGALRAVDLRGSRLPGGQPASHRRDHGHDPHRHPARGDPARHGLAPAGDRLLLHRLRLFWSVDARRADPPGVRLGRDRQPPLPDQPGHLRHRAWCHLDLCVPFRTVRRDGHTDRAGAALHRPRLFAGGTFCGRTGEGLGPVLRNVGVDLGLVHRQHGHHWLTDHPGDDPDRLSAPLRGGGRGGQRQLVDRSRHQSWEPSPS